jgi:hypothetical protein
MKNFTKISQKWGFRCDRIILEGIDGFLSSGLKRVEAGSHPF